MTEQVGMGQNAHGFVSIILLNWNGYNDTIECIESLQKITYPNYEIVVVDNASKGDDVERLRTRYGSVVRIIQNDANLGFAEGNNVGVRDVLARGVSQYVLFLNSDTIVESNFLDRLVAKAESNPKIGLVGPEIRYYYDRDKTHSRGGIIDLYTGWHFVGGTYHQSRYRDDSQFVLDFYSGCAVMIRTDLLKRLGGFDPQYFYYVEDVDLGYRVRRAGYLVASESTAVIYHKEGASVGGNTANPLTAFYQTRNTILFIRKHGQWYHRLVFYPVLALKMLYDLIKFWPTERKIWLSRWRGIAWQFTHRPTPPRY